MRSVALLLAALLLTGFAPLGAAQGAASKEFRHDDGAADVRFGPSSQGAFPPGMPPSPATDYVDLTSLRVFDESVDGVRIAIGLQTFAKPAFTFSTHEVMVEFAATTSPPVSYTLRWEQTDFMIIGSQNTSLPMAPTLCFHAAAQQAAPCLAQRVVGWMDFEETELVAFIPKSSLLGIDPLRPEQATPTPVTLPPGTALGNFSVESRGDFWSDRLPDAGEVGSYVLRLPAANERLRITRLFNETALAPTTSYAPEYTYSPNGARSGDFPVVSIEPGAPFAVPLEVKNLNGAKRLVNLSIEFLGPQDSGKWQLRIAPSLQVPGADARVVNLMVNATSQVQHRESTLIRVLGQSVGFPDEMGSQTLRLVATVPPSPVKKTLYLHAAGTDTSGFIASTCDLPTPFLSSCTPAAYLNTVEEDESATADDRPVHTFSSVFSGGPNQFLQGASQVAFSLEQPLPRDLVLNINENVRGEIAIGTQQAFDGALTVELHAGNVFIGGVTKPIAAADLQEPIPFEFLPLVNSERIPAGEVIFLNVRMTFSYVGASAVLMAYAPGVVPQGSFVELPIMADPRAKAKAPIGDDALISLSVRGDRDDFVNSGESRAFNVTVVNEGVDQEVVNVTGVIQSGPCGIQIRPGQRFTLSPGDSAKMGVFLRANVTAKEGERCIAKIEASPQSNPASLDSLLLEVIVTNGLDLTDDDDNYTVDEDSVSKIHRSGGGKAPGPLLVTTLLIALGAAAWRRRVNRA